MTVNPLAPIGLNGATLAAFTVENPSDCYSRVTVTREPGRQPFVVRRDSVLVQAHDSAVDAIAHAMNLAGWLEPVLDTFTTI